MNVAVQIVEQTQMVCVASVTQLKRKEKAATVHLTGNEKIFQLAQVQADKKILWLGSREYIYVTQLESLACCGAQQWSGAVQCITANLGAKLLELSSTNVQYLDNMRNMADGYIANGVSLGETIVRGILLAPKYETTVFKFQNEVEQTDGLDQVFACHMTNKSGKHIVFYSDMEHMHGMMEQSKDWSSGVNECIRFYIAYSEDPGTSKAL